MAKNKKTVQRPQYQQFEDTPFITQNRQLQNQTYGALTDQLGNIGNLDTNYYRQLQSQYTGSMMDDLNRSYQKAVNNNLQRQYNRLGTTGSSSGLYTADDINITYNDLASRVASQGAQYYQNLVNDEYNRQLNTANLYNALFNRYGNVGLTQDLRNYGIQNANLENRYLTDVARENNKTNIFGNILKGATSGMSVGGGWGALAGGLLGGLSNSNL